MKSTINIIFLAAEAEPFVKVGGLADVAGSLPVALGNLPFDSLFGTKIDIRLVLPLHRSVRVDQASLTKVAEFSIYRRGGNFSVVAYLTEINGLPVYFIAGEPISGASSVYSNDSGSDREKYAFFSFACMELLRHLDWQADILHANDWHTALSLYALRTRQTDPKLMQLRSVLTVHNLPFMGGDGTDVLAAYGLVPPNDEALPHWARTQPLPLGLWSADRIVPVSRTYANEILTPDFGCGLESFLLTRQDGILGILNGLDINSYNPATDKAIAFPFDINSLAGRPANKEALQKQLGLQVNRKIPMIGMVGRVDHQKGVDIAIQALSQIKERSWQFVLLGSGAQELENAVKDLQAELPDRVHAALRYDADLGRQIYASSDIFLMPSRYEPCGLAQMIAMRYGSIPVVRATGGLLDTVEEGKTGFLFPQATSESLLQALHRALTTFTYREKWTHYQLTGMAKDFSWENSARQYASLYRTLLENG